MAPSILSINLLHISTQISHAHLKSNLPRTKCITFPSLPSLFIYLKKKKKKKIPRYSVVLARNLGTSHSQILFVFQHPLYVPWSLPLWYNSQTSSWIYPYLVASVQDLFHSSTHTFIIQQIFLERLPSLSISHLLLAVITCFLLLLLLLSRFSHFRLCATP